MGQEIGNTSLSFVSFQPKDKRFVAYLALEGLDSRGEDPEAVLKKAANIYEKAIKRMKPIIDEIKKFRTNRNPIPARKIWQLGNIIFDLKNSLETISLQIDDLYLHLVRELGVKRKWLEKVVIFRRYLKHEYFIPKTLNWGACEKGTRRVAEKLSQEGYIR